MLRRETDVRSRLAAAAESPRFDIAVALHLFHLMLPHRHSNDSDNALQSPRTLSGHTASADVLHDRVDLPDASCPALWALA